MTLKHPVSPSDQVVTVERGSLHLQDVLTIDGEEMRVISLLGAASAQVLRGQEGTAAILHKVGAQVTVSGGLDWRRQRRAVRDEMAQSHSEVSAFETWARQQITALTGRLDALERRK